ncbi:Fic family protein [Patescibacteria group bacterium]
MFEPKYTLSTTLLSTITQIERLYGQIEALRLPKELEINLERKNLIKSAYASNRIEGNPLTMPEVTNLLLDDRIPTNRDEKEVVNYFNILKELNTYKDQSITVDLVKKFHTLLMTGVDKTAGEIRNIKVVVGKFREEAGDVSLKVKHDPPHHKKDEIVSNLSLLFEWIEKETALPAIISTGIFHHEFVYIHPFEDGNGRVCRLLNALMFIKKGYEINRYFVLDDYYDIDRHQYSDKLHSADLGDKTEWLEYYSEGVMYSLKSALARAKQAVSTLKIELQPTPKEKNVLDIINERQEVTSQNIADELKVSRQQAHNLLRSLVEKNLLDKRGSTKSSYYVLK